MRRRRDLAPDDIPAGALLQEGSGQGRLFFITCNHEELRDVWNAPVNVVPRVLEVIHMDGQDFEVLDEENLEPEEPFVFPHLAGIFESLHEAEPLIKACGQWEVGVENGVPHYHALLHFERKRRFNQVRALLPGVSDRWDIRQVKSVKAVRRYVTKQETRAAEPVFFPSEEAFNERAAGQGRRSDLLAVKEDIAAGLPREEIAARNPVAFMQYARGIDNYISTIRPERPRMPDEERVFVKCIVGVPGAGKSRAVMLELREEIEAGNVYFKGHTGKWYDGYRGQPIVVFNDFDGSEMRHRELVRLLDDMPFRVERKGDSLEMQAKRFYFTSNTHPKFWYSKVMPPATWATGENPLRRRFTEIRFMGERHEAIVRQNLIDEVPEDFVPPHLNSDAPLVADEHGVL